MLPGGSFKHPLYLNFFGPRDFDDLRWCCDEAASATDDADDDDVDDVTDAEPIDAGVLQSIAAAAAAAAAADKGEHEDDPDEEEDEEEEEDNDEDDEDGVEDDDDDEAGEKNSDGDGSPGVAASASTSTWLLSSASSSSASLSQHSPPAWRSGRCPSMLTVPRHARGVPPQAKRATCFPFSTETFPCPSETLPQHEPFADDDAGWWRGAGPSVAMEGGM